MAGIKVIMVTGDQPATAAAIAQKVNIIKHPKREYNNLKAAGMSEKEAMEQSTGIVIHGNTLAKLHMEEEAKDIPEEEKGRYL